MIGTTASVWALVVRVALVAAIVSSPSRLVGQEKPAPPLAPKVPRQASPQESLKVMTWNIWHGGREDGAEAGPARVIEVIRESGADLVAMQETYGSGPRIAKGLGFHFHPRGTNVSIHSRYPVVEDISVHKPFECVGALVGLPDGLRLAFYGIWLPYSAEIWAAGTRDPTDPEAMRAACAASEKSLRTIWKAIQARLAAPEYRGVPLVIAGDFNSMSHLDYGEVGRDQYRAVVEWPTSRVLTDAGFVDTYRACRPHINRDADWTWTPRFPDQERDRIDFIYARAPGWSAASSRVLRDHPVRFPSDHAAVLTTLRRDPAAGQKGEQKLRVVTYNIKHGWGMDDKLDLRRTAEVLRGLDADVIGLQEVDLGARRSGGKNQVNELAGMLGMHPAFGHFMPFQGGHYGMAILSRHPIQRVIPVRLPDGNEPRIALVVELRLPGGARILVANVHFDWVKDDRFRFAQAQKLAGFLRQQELPYLLLGDFNDGPSSRTVQLFRKLATEVSDSAAGNGTFPAPKPAKTIDFVFAAPGASWRRIETRVVDEKVASDHRPVLADVVLLRR